MRRSSLSRYLLILLFLVFIVASCGDPRNFEFSGDYNIDNTPSGSITLKCSFTPYTPSYGIDVVTISQLDGQGNPIEGCGGQKAMSSRLDRFFWMKDFTITVMDKNGKKYDLIIDDGWFKHSNVGLMGKDPRTNESIVIVLQIKKKNPKVSYKRR